MVTAANPNDDRRRGAPSLDPAKSATAIADDARDCRDEARTHEGLTRNDGGHRAIIPLAAGALILAALALIWRWIS
jgi:hypothetical protein